MARKSSRWWNVCSQPRWVCRSHSNADAKMSKMAGDVWQANGRNWSHHHVPLQPNHSSHQLLGCTGMWRNASARSCLIKTAPGPQAGTAATALSNRVYVSVPHALGILSLSRCPLGDDRWWFLLPVPSCFGASPSGDGMYLAGRVVSLRSWLMDARFSMSCVIEVGSLRDDGKFTPSMNFGGPV